MIRRSFAATCIALAIALGSGVAASKAGRNSTAGSVESTEGFGSARPVTPEVLANLLNKHAGVYLFDTRSRAEFEVSRIAKARRLDPASDIDFFAARYARRAKGRVFIFYCTASARSTMIAELTSDQLMDGGASAVYVLKGGLIAWANSNQQLINSRGSTRFIHPHDEQTAKLLRDPSRVVYSLGTQSRWSTLAE